MSVIDEIAAERQRQIDAEGWTPEHDDGHDRGELVEAAGCYVLHVNDSKNVFPAGEPPPGWPWEADWWKPKNPRHDLVRAGALIVAEIERMDRAATSPNETKG